jgi:hypothetical protein
VALALLSRPERHITQGNDMNRRAFLWVGSLAAAAAAMVGRGARATPAAPADVRLVEGSVLRVKGWERYSKAYAHAGEWVTCTGGHPICAFAETVHIGQLQDLPRQLIGWTQKEPEVGADPMPVCARCGAEFVRGGGGFHFPGGWR